MVTGMDAQLPPLTKTAVVAGSPMRICGIGTVVDVVGATSRGPVVRGGATVGAGVGGSRPDALTMAVTGPNPKPAAQLVVTGTRATGLAMLPGGARASSKIVLKPAKGAETVLPLTVGCTGSGADGSLALASARL